MIDYISAYRSRISFMVSDFEADKSKMNPKLRILIYVKIFLLVCSMFIIQKVSRHEQVCIIILRFKRYFSHHRAFKKIVND